jgi:membrane fusion protein, multidrug efflux system
MRSLGFCIALLVGAAATACSTGNESAVAAASQQAGRGSGAAVPVAVGHVVRKSMPVELKVIGTVEPASTVSIRAQITGELTSVGFKEGDDVQQGAVLFTLDRRPLEAALKQAEANLQRDTAQAKNANTQAQRAADLAQRGIVTREQVDTSTANASALAATLEADRAAIDNVRIQLQYATITAPIAGRTGQLMVHEGNLVRANDTTPLVVINQLSPIDVTFAVPEAQLGPLKRAMSRGPVSVSVELPNDAASESTGRVTFVDNAVDPTTGTIKIKGSFANRDRGLWPGQFVNVVITLATDADAIVAPTAAVQTGPDNVYVFVVKPDQTAEVRPITIGRTSGPETIVSSGLEADDVVVTDGQLRLVPGSRVTIRSDAQKAEQ